MDDIEALDNPVVMSESAPTTFAPTHFHKNNLGGKIPLMLNPADGKFYWETTTQDGMGGAGGKSIQPWNGNPENRSGWNPASVDGEYKDGKEVEYPEGTTYKTAQAAPAAPAQNMTQTPPENGGVEVKPVAEPAATVEPAAEPAAPAVTAPEKKLLPVDPKVKGFQDEVKKLDPKAFPKYGADGRMGSETQGEIAKHPDIAAKYGLKSNKPAPDVNVGGKPAPNATGSKYAGQKVGPAPVLGQMTGGGGRQTPHRATQADVDQWMANFGATHNPDGTPKTSAQPNVSAKPATVDTTKLPATAKPGDKFWIDGKRYEYTGHPRTGYKWKENVPFTWDNQDADYKRQTAKYSGPDDASNVSAKPVQESYDIAGYLIESFGYSAD